MSTQKKRLQRSTAVIFMLLMVLSFSMAGCGGEPQAGSGNSADGVTNWSFYSAYGPEDGACCEIWLQLFKEVEEATGGRLVITTYWSGQHPYEGEDMLRAMEEGSAQIVHFYGGYLSSVEPIFALDTMPLMFPSEPMDAWDAISRLWGDFNQDTDGVLEGVLQERWNATMVHMVPASPQRFFTAGYEVTGADSLKGHKVRTYSPEFAKLVQELGGTPVSIAFSEVYTSLATNLIDGLITSAAFADSGGFFDYVDTIGMWELSQSTDGLAVSLDALDALPDDVREIFLNIMRQSAQKPEMLEVEQNDAIVDELVQSGKVKLFTPTDAQREEVVEIVSEAIWQPWLDTVGIDGERALKQIEDDGR